MSDIIITRAEKAHLQGIIHFQQMLAKETEGLRLDPDVLLAGVSAVFSDPNKGRYFVALKEGQLIASLMITVEWSDWRNGDVWWIQSVYVLPEFRRLGVFRRMYEFIREKVIETQDVKGIRLYVDLTNHGARKVYDLLGMNGDHYQLYEWMKP